jgi:flagellar biosynthesis/type III secretory pathway protein FliH
MESKQAEEVYQNGYNKGFYDGEESGRDKALSQLNCEKLKAKIEGVTDATWCLVQSYPTIDPNGKLEKQMKYLLDGFTELKANLEKQLKEITGE